MTRKEIIIKAWMDLNIETPFGICDKTGWVHGYFCNGIDDITNYYGDITDKIDYDIDMSGVGKFRPKSLHGIENNNGWIKIKSEDDLPKKRGTFWTFIEGKEVVMNTFNTFDDMEFTFDNGKVTHYKPLIKPNEPIY